MLLIGITIYTVMEAGIGYLVGLTMGLRIWWVGWVLTPVIVLLGWLALRLMDRYGDLFWNYADGASGEERVAKALRNLSDEFHVIHGIETPHGDVDHLVIGPTGVFCLDAKHWSGNVTHDGNSGLLVNNYPTDKPVLKLAKAQALALRDMLCETDDGPYFQGVLVFVGCNLNLPATIAYVDCLRVEELSKHLTRKKGRPVLSEDRIRHLASRADACLGKKATAAPRSGS
jgi:hypothetical protein